MGDSGDYIDSFDLELLEDHEDRNVQNNIGQLVENINNVVVRENNPVPSTSTSEGTNYPLSLPVNIPVIPQLDPSLTTNISSHRLMGLRMVELEERMGIFQFAIWKMPVEGAAEIVRRLIIDVTGIDCSLNEIIIVSALDAKRQGVLVRVSTLNLKRLIFKCKMLLIFRGYNIDYL